jgi:hypothetical protein
MYVFFACGSRSADPFSRHRNQRLECKILPEVRHGIRTVDLKQMRCCHQLKGCPRQVLSSLDCDFLTESRFLVCGEESRIFAIEARIEISRNSEISSIWDRIFGNEPASCASRPKASDDRRSMDFGETKVVLRVFRSKTAVAMFSPSPSNHCSLLGQGQRMLAANGQLLDLRQAWRRKLLVVISSPSDNLAAVQ